MGLVNPWLRYPLRLTRREPNLICETAHQVGSCTKVNYSRLVIVISTNVFYHALVSAWIHVLYLRKGVLRVAFLDPGGFLWYSSFWCTKAMAYLVFLQVLKWAWDCIWMGIITVITDV